ncbi:unnamed protein product [Citrullus colocynthis]|uniref:Uncharacterized protein n=1 Tax=Citrullus colocynthis TaxID=252529 RepID=A0ABP0YGD1_9ROSI
MENDFASSSSRISPNCRTSSLFDAYHCTATDSSSRSASSLVADLQVESVVARGSALRHYRSSIRSQLDLPLSHWLSSTTICHHTPTAGVDAKIFTNSEFIFLEED